MEGITKIIRDGVTYQSVSCDVDGKTVYVTSAVIEKVRKGRNRFTRTDVRMGGVPIGSLYRSGNYDVDGWALAADGVEGPADMAWLIRYELSKRDHGPLPPAP